MGKPFAYLRKSVMHAGDPNDSAEAQEAAVRSLAARYSDNGDRLTILSDWDRSGRLGRDKRPGYDRLWQAIETGEASAVYSYSMSRLARSVSELSRLFETCGARNIPVRLVADVVDTSTASGRMTATILASVAQFEADVAGERRRAANGAKLARGESLRTVPFYGEREGDDPEAVLAAFREARSFAGAARLLNERKVPTRTSRWGWRPSSVAVVVRRLDPDAMAPRPSQRVAAGGSAFILARLLRCPFCETFLTGGMDRRTGRVRYTCHMSVAKPHDKCSVSEHLILPAIQAEAAHLRMPEAVEASEGDEAKRRDLEARRARILDMREAGQIDRAETDRRLEAVAEGLAALQERAVLLALPAVDWSWPRRELNAVLRALWQRVDLDPGTFAPVAFEWTVPEWRAP